MTDITKNRKAWAEALRSGEFKQTSGYLENVDEKGNPVGNCCLGVLCRLAIADGVQIQTWTSDEGVDEAVTAFDDGTVESRVVAPRAAMAWVGLKRADGAFADGEDVMMDSLASKNDSGMTFKQIAALIEREPKGLFVDA